MSTWRQRDRCRERLERLGRSSVRRDVLQREAIGELRVVGFERWCWPAADPETLVPGLGVADHDYGPLLSRALELEYAGGDYAAKDVVARRPRPVGSLNTDTKGDLARSSRWDEVLRPVGIGDTATVACRDAFGCWGWVDLHRDASDGPFSEDDLTLLADIAPVLGSALRTGVSDAGAANGLADPRAGIVVLDGELRLVSLTTAAREWMDLLPAAALFTQWDMLPPPVYPVGTLARVGRVDQARALVQTVTGRWVRIEAAPLIGDHREIALTLRAAAPAETLALLARAHGFTKRERELLVLLVAGMDTAAITKRLRISAHTVQDHLKLMFAKVRVHSRRELVAKLHGQLDDPDVAPNR